VVDVVLKPEILDPQGQAIVGALRRLGIEGVSDVRQGKHFELLVEDAVDDETVQRLADTLLANPVIEDYTVTRLPDDAAAVGDAETAPAPGGSAADDQIAADADATPSDGGESAAR
jgi:phosphoribosylformylglycinamidine synthase